MAAFNPSILFETPPLQFKQILRKNLIISRIENDKVLLDFRTILEKDIAKIEEMLKKEFKNV